MANEQVHLTIRKVFGLVRQVDNLPWGAGRRRSRHDLATVFKLCGFTRGAEIGVRRGAFSEALCKGVPGLQLSCVDPWNAYSNKYPQAKQDRIYAEAVARLAPYAVTILRKTSLDALADFADGSLDFVFIDGNHAYDYVAPDIIYWSQKVKSGGIVAVHDYYAFGWSGVMPAVNGYVASHDIRPWYVTKELEPTAFWVRP
jgi:hypothetical protein